MSTPTRNALVRFSTTAIAITGLTAAAACFAGSPADSAQADPSGAGRAPAPTAPLAAEGKVTDKKLRQFATAAADVQQIQEEYAAKAQSLQKEAEEKIVSSVQGAGMSVAEFASLVKRVQSDPDLARRLDDMKSL